MPNLTDILATVPHNLTAAEAQWQRLRQPPGASHVIEQHSHGLGSTDWDVIVCGGTLGILLALALQRQGYRVLVLERGRLQGRDQEWNISRAELQTLTRLDLLTAAELEVAIASEFNPVRVQFAGGEPIWLRDVLNIGISPKTLLAQLKAAFLAAGGSLQEQTAFLGAVVHPDGVAVRIQAVTAAAETLTTRLLIDAMGHFSPIQQQARADQTPRGICLVVGGCAQGLPERPYSDLMVTLEGICQQRQHFWEAFPAASGRTTYCFTYVDTLPQRPSLRALLEYYWQNLGAYQDCDPESVHFERLIAGVFPSYSEVASRWPRILAVGDSSGQQSPLSFGGFGAMLRHLPRLLAGASEALKADQLADLSLLQPYQPNLAVTWLFQQAMMVPVDAVVPESAINQLLDSVFQAMQARGPTVLTPFVRDVIQFPALTEALMATLWRNPGVVAAFVQRVGIGPLLHWLPHYLSLGRYHLAYQLWGQRAETEQARVWKYGAGLDLAD
ncbi:MAG: FAD-binding oxidoreductase [Synechococcaceae cyanobacterium SM2_3_60]|nr:FAD-binding oxidoreductase [Synechococcaceae cyanobacterium SM2_3_60]